MCAMSMVGSTCKVWRGGTVDPAAWRRSDLRLLCVVICTVTTESCVLNLRYRAYSPPLRRNGAARGALRLQASR